MTSSASPVATPSGGRQSEPPTRPGVGVLTGFSRAASDPGLDPGLLRLVRVVVVIRAAAALVVAAVGSYLPGLTDGQEDLFLVLGLLWLPWSIGLLLIVDQPQRRLVRYGGPLSDLLMLTAVAVVVPQVPALALMIGVVAFALYTCPELPIVLPGGIALVLTALAVPWHHSGLDTALRLSGFTIVLILVTTLRVRMAAHEHASQLATAALHSRADTILARVPMPLVLTAPDGVVRSWNDESHEVLGTQVRPGTTCADALGLHLGERALDCSAGCALLAIRADAPPGGEDSVEVWRSREDGTRQPILVSVAEIHAADGSVSEVIHALRDITRLKQAEEAKTMFLATASHELKTPLTVIHGFAEMLLRTGLEDEQLHREALHAIERRSTELTRIVDRLLLSSRIEAGRLMVDMRSVDGVDIINERTRAIQAATGRRVSVDRPDDVPPILADPTAVATVLDHLIDNAIKYSADLSPVAVRVSATQGHVRIDVTDHGIGMDQDQLRHCFDKFWQAESTDARRYGGAGIGLYIVKSVIDSMGANVQVTSQLGEGSTFMLTFTRADSDATAPRQRRGGGVAADVEPEPSMIREFMRQIGVPSGADE